MLPDSPVQSVQPTVFGCFLFWRRPAWLNSLQVRGVLLIQPVESHQSMNAAVNSLYAEYLDHTGGDKAAAASLTLAAVMAERPPAVAGTHNQPLTVPEVAKLLRVSPDKVLSWIRSGQLRGYNIAERENGRPKYRVNPDDLDAFANRRCVVRPSPTGRPVGSRRGRFADLPDELPDI